MSSKNNTPSTFNGGNKKQVLQQFDVPPIAPNTPLYPVYATPIIRIDPDRPSVCYFDLTFLESGSSSSSNGDANGGNALKLKNVRDIDAIIFKNYYTSSLTISTLVSTTEASSAGAGMGKIPSSSSSSSSLSSNINIDLDSDNGRIGSSSCSTGTGTGIVGDVYVPILENRAIMSSPYYENGSQEWNTIFVSEFNENYVPGKSLRFTLFQPCPVWIDYDIKHVYAVGIVRNTNPIMLVADGGINISNTGSNAEIEAAWWNRSLSSLIKAG